MRRLWEVITSKHIAALLAIIGFGIAIYQTWFQDKRPALTFEVTANAKVLDIRTPVKGLEIRYGGEDLRATNQELRLMSVRITNSGHADISKKDYDDEDPLGFRVLHAKLVQTPTIESSSEYLSQYLKVSQIGSDKLVLSPVILDTNDSVQIQFLAVAAAGQVPLVQPFGKVAGVKTLEVVDTEQASKAKPWWQTIFESDSAWVQILRWVLYAAVAMGGLVVFAFAFSVVLIPVHVLSDYKDRGKRSRLILEYARGRDVGDADRFVLDQFKQKGSGAILNWRKYVLKVGQRKNVASLRGQIDDGTLKAALAGLKTRWPFSAHFGTVPQDNPENEVDHELAEAAEDFAAYLESKGELKPPPPERVFFEEPL